MHDEGNYIYVIRQEDEALLEPHQEVIDLACFVLSLVLLNGSNGERVPFALVHELAVVRFAFFLEGCHWRLLSLSNASPMSPKRVQKNCRKFGFCKTGQGAAVDVTPCPIRCRRQDLN